MATDLLQTCLLAGRMMIEGGSEMYRVDDTMTRIAKNGGAQAARVFTTPTGLFIAVDGAPTVQLEPIVRRGIDMEKVAGVNQLSRAFQAGEIDLAGLHAGLVELDRHTPTFSLWWQLFAAALCSTTLMVLFAGGYDWADMPLAAVVGALGFGAYLAMARRISVRFVSELIGGFVVAITAWLAVRIGLGVNLDNVIIGGVMPLVPGVAMTNSIRDMLAGHLLSGLVRGMEAILTAAAIGVGVAVIFRFL